MRTRIESRVLPALIAGIGLVLASRVTAQVFTNLHSFTALVANTNGDGANPYNGLLLLGDTLYGTAENGGKFGKGTVFAINTNGLGFTNLYSFSATHTNLGGVNTNGDGVAPGSVLILSDGLLYGEALQGGSQGNGTVFAVNTNGMGFTNVHSFTNSDGNFPIEGLILSSNTLYGTAFGGGNLGIGSVFAVNTNGSSFTNVHVFTNSDGAFPQEILVLSGNTLYGETMNTASNQGTVFAVKTDGSGFTNFHYFTGPPGDGSNPQGGLVLAGGILYGTTEGGGTYSNGTVFAIGTNGMGYTNLYSFTATTGLHATNMDGAHPGSSLVSFSNTLFGTTGGGGAFGFGAVFAVNTNGMGFRNLHSFTATGGPNLTNSDGAYPYAGLILSSNTLYGATESGGTNGKGTVFSLFVPDLTGQSFNAALNTTGLVWTTGGDTSWFVETTNTFDGVSAAQSGIVTNNQSSTLSVTVTGLGVLTFYWSSIASNGGQFQCEFAIDGNPNNFLVGNTPWYQYGPVTISPGQHTLSWTASANGDIDPTQAAFLDQVSYVPFIPVTLLHPQIVVGPNFQAQFPSQAGFLYDVQYNTDLLSGGWLTYTSIPGDGTTQTISIPLSFFSPSQEAFVRVSVAY